MNTLLGLSEASRTELLIASNGRLQSGAPGLQSGELGSDSDEDETTPGSGTHGV
jgi:hypothetical protein